MSGFWSLYTGDMAHRHVLIGYAFAWVVQIGYLLSVLRRSSWNGKSKSGKTPSDLKQPQ